jgi:hypothetical protein
MTPTEYLDTLSKKESALLAAELGIGEIYMKRIVRQKHLVKLKTACKFCELSNGKVTLAEWIQWLQESKNG